MTNHYFEVVGLNDSYTVLHECNSSSDALQWTQRYISKENAGNWPCIEIYDMRSYNSERVWFWVNPNLDFT